MRLPVEFTARLYGGLIALPLAAALAGCSMLGGGAGSGNLASATPPAANGPQADYPVLVGDPYDIDGQTHRPNDTLNYDEVGYLTVDTGASGYTGAHHTLPVPSYAEVTSLTTGRTILVRLERRGPMTSNHLLALAPAALAQLDATAETPVRVRRVNPPEEQRLMLRMGQSAPLRMDTPMPLVSVLLRRLPAPQVAVATPVPPSGLTPASPPAPVETGDARPTITPLSLPEPDSATAATTPAPIEVVASVPTLTTLSVPEPVPAAAATTGEGLVVQAGAFSSESRAAAVATAIGGTVSRSGNLYRVRTGPFPSRAAAEASLANVRAAGYSDARILTGG